MFKLTERKAERGVYDLTHEDAIDISLHPAAGVQWYEMQKLMLKFAMILSGNKAQALLQYKNLEELLGEKKFFEVKFGTFNFTEGSRISYKAVEHYENLLDTVVTDLNKSYYYGDRGEGHQNHLLKFIFEVAINTKSGDDNADV